MGFAPKLHPNNFLVLKMEQKSPREGALLFGYYGVWRGFGGLVLILEQDSAMFDGLLTEVYKYSKPCRNFVGVRILLNPPESCPRSQLERPNVTLLHCVSSVRGDRHCGNWNQDYVPPGCCVGLPVGRYFRFTVTFDSMAPPWSV